MHERYYRRARAAALPLRDAVAQKVAPGWAMAPSFRLPQTACGDSRIGKPTSALGGTLPGKDPTPSAQSSNDVTAVAPDGAPDVEHDAERIIDPSAMSDSVDPPCQS